MRKVIYSMLPSLDGYIAGPNDEIDWSQPDEELHSFINKEQDEVDTHLYGRRTYEMMAEFWPTADEAPDVPEHIAEYARIWRGLQKVVFSRTLDSVGPNARLISDNIAEEVAKLKAQPGKDMGLGGAGLAASFIQLGLIDEYRLYVHPVVLGEGKPMFRTSGDPLNLSLVETRTFDSGVVYLRYQNAAREGE